MCGRNLMILSVGNFTVISLSPLSLLSNYDHTIWYSFPLFRRMLSSFVTVLYRHLILLINLRLPFLNI